MTINIRLHVPSLFLKLASEWTAIQKWNNPDYLINQIQNNFFEVHNYLSEDPFKNFAGGHVFTNQKGKIVTFFKFWKKYNEKFTDKNLRDP